MQSLSSGDNLHEMSNIIFWEKQEKKIQNVYQKFYLEC